MRKIFTLLLIVLLPTVLVAQVNQAAQNSPIVFNQVTVIDVTGAPSKSGMTVIITGERIVKIGKTGKVKIPKNVQIIDGAGKFLIPAFWDMHVHILTKQAEWTLPLLVANGVLGVRDLGVYQIDDILRFREEAATGKIISPRIVTSGRILDGHPPASPDYSIVVKTPEEGRKAVRDLKKRGVDCVKVYDVLSRETYFAIADEAKKLKIPFVGHVPTAVTSIEASDAGQKSIEHLGKVLEESSDSPEKIRQKQTEPIKEGDYFAFTTRLGGVYDLTVSTYSEKKAKEIFSHFVKNETWQVPTLTVKYGRRYIDELDAGGDLRTKYIPESERKWWNPKVGFFFRYRTPEYIAAHKKYYQKELEVVGAMKRAGVKFLTGTDINAPYVFPGFGLHDELALFVEAGFSPLEALQTATINPAKFLGLEKSLGTVEKGKLADLILLEANPLDDIKNTRKISAVIAGGRYLSKEKLQEMLRSQEQR